MSRTPKAVRSLAPRLGLAAILALFAFSPATRAATEEVALVEDIDAPSAGAQFMDYLSAGQVIRLRAGEKIVIDYLRSCVRETIAGGSVTIGAEESLVAGGKIRRERVECDGGKMLLTAEQASKSGVMVFRNGSPKPQSPLMLYGTSPLIDLQGGGKVVLERLDRPGDSRVVDIVAGKARTPPYDCAKHDVALAPGGTYRATAGAKELIFRVAEAAKPGSTPIVGRLLRF
jgi:hypothetical protein